MRAGPKQNRITFLAITIASRFVAIIVGLSFLLMLVPIGTALAGNPGAMPCCIGKSAGHCDSGLSARKRRQPKPELMCGLKPTRINDEITVVAEPFGDAESQDSSTPAVASASLSKPCPMDCNACAGRSARQQKRERGSAHSSSPQNPPSTILWKPEARSTTVASNEDFERASPRGPPISLHTPITSN
jgi:hypothetical protein